jgi:hypothetical protein
MSFARPYPHNPASTSNNRTAPPQPQKHELHHQKKKPSRPTQTMPNKTAGPKNNSKGQQGSPKEKTEPSN